MAKRGGAIKASTRLERLTLEILERKARVGRDLWEIGRRLEIIRDEALWSAGGHDSFDAYLDHHLGISPRNARRFIRIARHFSREVAKRYGADKLEAILRYEEVTPAEERPGDLLAAAIRVRGAGGRFVTASLHEATAPQIREAIALLEQAKKGGRERIPASLSRRVEELALALPPPPPGMRTGRRVRLRRAKSGELAVSFAAIPVSSSTSSCGWCGITWPRADVAAITRPMPKSHGKERRAAKQKKRRVERQKTRAAKPAQAPAPRGEDFVASCGYDANQPLDARAWLALEERARLDRVAKYHMKALDPSRLPPSLPRHAGMHVGIENQIAAGNPPQVLQAVGRLVADGMSRHDAVHAVGWVMTEHMRKAVESRKPIDNDAYLRDLEELTLPRWLEMAGVKR